MKVLETITKGEYGEDDRIEIKIITDTYTGSVEFGSGEPEDMYLSRDLADAYSIESLVSAAYEAGKRGEDYEAIYDDGDDE